MVKICILCGIMARRTNAAWGHVEGGYLEKTLRMKTCSKCLVAKEESEFSGRLTHCKPCRASIERQRRVDNAEEIRRKDRARGKLRTKESRRQYYEANKDACIARSKRCYARRKSLGIKPPKWVPKDARSKIRTILRDRIKSLPKDNRCGGHWLRLVGAQPEHVKRHLEAHFKDGMSWCNYGMRGWHVDHYVPLAYFDLQIHENTLIAFNWRNLRPEWARDNLRKAASVPHDAEAFVAKLKLEILNESVT